MSDDQANASPPTGVSPDRKALRRLGGLDDFDRILDLLHEWRHYNPNMTFCAMLGVLASRSMSRDSEAAKRIQDAIVEARTDRIHSAIRAMGLDKAERVLGLELSTEEVVSE